MSSLSFFWGGGGGGGLCTQIMSGYLRPFPVSKSHLYNSKYCVCCCCAQYDAVPGRTERFKVKEVSLICTLIGVSLVAKEMDHCETQQILRMLHNFMLKSNLLCRNIVRCGILVVVFVCFLSSLQLWLGVVVDLPVEDRGGSSAAFIYWLPAYCPVRAVHSEIPYSFVHHSQTLNLWSVWLRCLLWLIVF